MIELLSRVISIDVSEVGFDFRASRDGVITPLLEWEVSRVDSLPAMDPEARTINAGDRGQVG